MDTIDTLESVSADDPIWLVIRTTTGYVIECGEVESGADLRAAIVDRLAQLRSGGWEAEDDIGESSTLLIRRNSEVLQLLIAAGAQELRCYDMRKLADAAYVPAQAERLEAHQ